MIKECVENRGGKHRCLGRHYAVVTWHVEVAILLLR